MIDLIPAGALIVAFTWTVAPMIPANVPDELTEGAGKTSSSFWHDCNSVNTARTASYINPLNQNVQITGSLVVSGSGATIELYGDKIIAGAVGGSEGGEILLNKSEYISEKHVIFDTESFLNYGDLSKKITNEFRIFRK